MEPIIGYENKTIIKTLQTSHLTTPFPSFLSLPIQTFNPNEREGDRDIEAITQCTFFELIQQGGDTTPFMLALIKDSSGAFAAYNALALRDWVVKKPINPLSQATITQTSLYAIDSLLGQCEFLGSSESVDVLVSLIKNIAKSELRAGSNVEDYQSEDIVKDLDISHLTKPFSSKIKFSIQRYNPATKKQEMVIEVLTKRSFVELIKARETSSLSFVLALIEDCQGEFAVYDASELEASVSRISANSPLRKEIKRISWYKIDRQADDFTFLGDSISAQARFIDSFIRANTGDLQAQYELGCMYAEGTQVAKDSNHAMHFFRLAARAGHLQAFLRTLPELIKEQKITEIVEFFKTVKVEKVREIEVPYVDLFYTEAIPLKDIRYDLLLAIRRNKSTYKVTYLRGKCFKEGVGTDQSSERALAFFEEASWSCSKACYELAADAIKFEDFARAKDYLIRAGKAHVPSHLLLVKLYLSPSDPNFKAAVKILNRLCEQKIKEAFMPLADICMRGEGGFRNYERAYELLKRASEFDAGACCLLARELIKQKESKFSFKPELGFKLIEKAIKMEPNDGRLYWLRFCCYRDGLGVGKSDASALGALMEGVKLKDEKCAEHLGYAFYHGRYGLVRDLNQATQVLTIAAHQVDAQILLAKIYSENTDSAEQRKAVQIYQNLAAQRVALAFYELHLIYRDGLLGQKPDPQKSSDYLNYLKDLDEASHYLQVGVDRLAYFATLPEFSYRLSKVTKFMKRSIAIRNEIEELLQKISALVPNPNNQTERLIYLISVFALSPFFYLNMEKPGQNELKTILLNKYKSKIEDELENVVEQGLVPLVFQLTELFHGLYNSENSNLDVKTLPRDINPILVLYKFCAHGQHPEAHVLWQNSFS